MPTECKNFNCLYFKKTEIEKRPYVDQDQYLQML